MAKTFFPYKKVVVFGAAKSGLFSALLLKKNDIEVFVSEKKGASDEFLKTIKDFEMSRIPYEFGGHTKRAFDGFDLAVLSPGIPQDSELVKTLKENEIPYIGEIELGLYFTNSPIIAITGSNGKSTTTTLTGHILKTAGLNVSVGGNLGEPFSKLILDNENPDYFVLEVSCFQLETIKNFKPLIAAFTNFSENHLDRYPSLESYFNAKKRIFLNQNNEDFAILNEDNETLSSLRNKLKAQVFTFSLEHEVKMGAFLDKNGIVIYKNNKNKEILFYSNDLLIKGAHNIANSLISSIVAKILGISNDKIKEGMGTFKGLEHRLETFLEKGGVEYINDSKSTTPDATVIALKAIKKPVVLILGGSSKGNDFKPLAQFITTQNNIKKIILVGKTANEIEKTLIEESFSNYTMKNNFNEAVEEAIKSAEPGDTVLLSPACASFDFFKDFEERGEHFKRFVLNYLKADE